MKTGPRKGDNAPMAIIELVEELEVATAQPTRAKAAKASARKAVQSDALSKLAGEDDAEETVAAPAADSDDEA